MQYCSVNQATHHCLVNEVIQYCAARNLHLSLTAKLSAGIQLYSIVLVHQGLQAIEVIQYCAVRNLHPSHLIDTWIVLDYST